jgi:prepilin-type N-terminal cleavage/methylation domain-containing protein
MRHFLLRHGGFSLVEILLSLALLTLIAGIGAPLFVSFQNRNDLDVASLTVVHALRRAQLLARAVSQDSAWGVSIGTSTVTIFQGSSYVARVVASDEISNISPTITKSGILEYVFSQFTGYPQVVGTTTLMSVQNESRIITINEKGTISY